MSKHYFIAIIGAADGNTGLGIWTEEMFVKAEPLPPPSTAVAANHAAQPGDGTVQ